MLEAIDPTEAKRRAGVRAAKPTGNCRGGLGAEPPCWDPRVGAGGAVVAKLGAPMRTALFSILFLVGCNSAGDGAAAPASASASATAAASASAKPALPVAVPVPAAEVAKVVNPNGEQPYAGPKGTLKGVIRYKGDPAPSAQTSSYPPRCGEAAATYGKRFRVGQDGTLADVLVAVTGYRGFVPAAEEAEKITIHGCATARRTIAMAFGQRLEVANLDKVESYMPYLDGGVARAVMVAVPGGEPIKLYPQAAGHYMLRDQLPKPFLTADVFVLAYATHDVTGLDGQYEIKGIPVGKVKVDAFLPAADVTTGQTVDIKEGDNTLDLTIEWPAPKPAASGSAKAGAPAPKKP